MNSVEGAGQSGNAVVDHRKRRRRRGAALYAAIFEATLEEWPSRAEMVVDAIHHTLPSLGEPPDAGSAREDLLACLRAVATLLNGLSGEAIRGLMAESLSATRTSWSHPDALRRPQRQPFP